MLRCAIIIVCLLSGIVQATELWVDKVQDCYGKEPCYRNINSAINNSNDGDLIWVVIGDYRENIDINKDNISLIGLMEGYEKPVIKSAGISGFSIDLPDLGPGGIVSSQRSSVLIRGNNTILKNFKIINDRRDGQVANGMSILSNGNLIENNEISLYFNRGILINASSDNNFSNNNIFNNTGKGIQLVSAKNNSIECNTLSFNGINLDLNSDSGSNLIFCNKLIQRARINVIDRNGSNSWDMNYYSDNPCDSDSYGICSEPLTLSGGSITDFNPLSDPKLNICQSDFCKLVVDASANPTFGRVGETILYKINVSNKGINGLNNIKVSSDKLQIFPIKLESLESGEYFSFNASYKIKEKDLPGPFIVSFNATGSSPMCRNRIWPSKPVSVSLKGGDINLIKNVTPSRAGRLTNVTFVINATNTGNTSLRPVIVKDILPDGLDYVYDNRSSARFNQNITWNITHLDPGKSEYIELVAQINKSASGTLWNKVNATGQPPAGDNITANDTEPVEVVDISPNISVDKTVSPNKGYPLTNVTFAINVTNNGNISLDQVTIVDTLPEGMEYINSTPGGIREGWNISWNLTEPLPANKSNHIKLVARIIQTSPGNLTNTVNATGRYQNGNITSYGNETVEVIRCDPNISIEKSVSPSSGYPQTIVKFIIKVTNTGDQPLKPVLVKDALPKGLNFVDST